MSRRINPVDQVVTFFETAPVETAVVVLAIVKGIVARRSPKTKTPARPRPTAAPALQPKLADESALTGTKGGHG